MYFTSCKEPAELVQVDAEKIQGMKEANNNGLQNKSCDYKQRRMGVEK